MKARKQTQADQEAADWIVRLHARDASAEDFAAHELWLKAKPENEYAYRIQQQLWAELPAVEAREDYEDLVRAPLLERWMFKLSLLGEALGEAVRRPQMVGGLALMVFVVAALSVSVPVLRQAVDPADETVIAQAPVEHATAIAEIRQERLPDGSVITLGAASRITVAFSETERRVTLLAGEAFFDVESDPSRPFFVEALGSVTRVVGTKFDVRLRSNTVSVAVAEGEVNVGRLIHSGTEASDPVVEAAASLTAGQAITLPVSLEGENDGTAPEAQPVPVQVTEINAADVATWREGRLTYVDARLADVVADLNRYYEGEIILGDDEVGEIAFTATPRANDAADIDRFLRAMDSQLPVTLVRRPNGRVILTRED